jgi:integrase/recombinase XerD
VLTDIEADINRLYYDMERAAEYITADRLLTAYLAKEKPRITLVNAWVEWEGQRAALVGRGISKATHVVYCNKGRLLTHWLRGAGKLKLLPEEFTEAQCDLFMAWLRTERGVSQNYTNKAVQVIKQFLSWAKRHGHAKEHPLDDYGLKNAPTPPPAFLTSKEINQLATHPFVSSALRKVVDVFLFQCYTGLAYVDLCRFDAREHVVAKNGSSMIIMGRQKTSHSTGQEATIPLLKPARILLLRYGDKLPVPSNQVYNRMLKEAAAVAGLGTKVTSHVGRKTAGRLWLDAGVPIAAVSKALGHRTIAMTEQYYVRVGEDLVAREFARVYQDDTDDE